jgi:hypothetical protein
VSAAETLARAEAAGVRLRLRPDGGVQLEAAAPPSAGLLADLRLWRRDVARLLIVREWQPELGAAPIGVHDSADTAAMARHYTAAQSARPYLPSDPDPLRDGLLTGALMRPPAWDGAAPPRGAWCSCCGRHVPQAGGRWWEPRRVRSDPVGSGPGWRCWACHPPGHLLAADVREVRT